MDVGSQNLIIPKTKVCYIKTYHVTSWFCHSICIYFDGAIYINIKSQDMKNIVKNFVLICSSEQQIICQIFIIANKK